jgi:hypothetical protein
MTLDTADGTATALPCFVMASAAAQFNAPSGFRSAQRRIAEALAGARVSAHADPASLESARLAPADPPRLASAEVLEDDRLARHEVRGEPVAGFAAFLDGIQVSRVLAHDDGIPVVLGSVAAVIRARVDRRLGTWRSGFEERLYVPRGFLSRESNAALDGIGLIVADTTPRRDGVPDESGRHPLSLADVAVHAVQEHREALELRLAEAWIGERDEPLYMDGGISGSSRAAASTHAIGVIKSHRTLYGDVAAIRLILGLGPGERSSVFAVASPNGWRATVASWYLRLRESPDPLWGLVRIEMSMPPSVDRRALGERAEQVSRWVLAETSPLALPDGRWDTMAYGVRDCEQYLKASIR